MTDDLKHPYPIRFNDGDFGFNWVGEYTYGSIYIRGIFISLHPSKNTIFFNKDLAGTVKEHIKNCEEDLVQLKTFNESTEFESGMFRRDFGFQMHDDDKQINTYQFEPISKDDTLKAFSKSEYLETIKELTTLYSYIFKHKCQCIRWCWCQKFLFTNDKDIWRHIVAEINEVYKLADEECVSFDFC